MDENTWYGGSPRAVNQIYSTPGMAGVYEMDISNYWGFMESRRELRFDPSTLPGTLLPEVDLYDPNVSAKLTRIIRNANSMFSHGHIDWSQYSELLYADDDLFGSALRNAGSIAEQRSVWEARRNAFAERAKLVPAMTIAAPFIIINLAEAAVVGATGGSVFTTTMNTNIVRMPLAVRIGGAAAKGSKPALPALDATGKVHGTLPKAKDLGRYSKEELQLLHRELNQSVRQRIKVTSRLGRDRAHGQRQGAEQDLIKAIEKHLQNR